MDYALLLEAARSQNYAQVRRVIANEMFPLHKIMRDYAWSNFGWGDDGIETVLRALHHVGVDVNALDERGDSVLAIALQPNAYCDWWVLDLLVEIMGANFNREETLNQCLLAVFETDRIIKKLKKVISCGCILPKDNRYIYLLFHHHRHGRTRSDYCDTLKLLLEMELVDVNAQDNEERDTPLHMMLAGLKLLFVRGGCASMSYELTRILLEAGASALIENAKEQTPLDVWISSEIPCGREVEVLLQKAMTKELKRWRRAQEKFLLFTLFARGVLGDNICHEMIYPLAVVPERPRPGRDERKKKLDEMLGKEGIAFKGVYYERCVDGIDRIDMEEFRLRHYARTDGADEYKALLKELRDAHKWESLKSIRNMALYALRVKARKQGISFKEPRRVEN